MRCPKCNEALRGSYDDIVLGRQTCSPCASEIRPNANAQRLAVTLLLVLALSLRVTFRAELSVFTPLERSIFVLGAYAALTPLYFGGLLVAVRLGHFSACPKGSANRQSILLLLFGLLVAAIFIVGFEASRQIL